MSNINVAVVTGRLGKDPEVKKTTSGKSVISFSLAVGTFKKDEVVWIDFEAWENHADYLAKYAKKGDKITVKGRINKRSWEDDSGKKKYATYVIVEHIELPPKEKGAGREDDGGASHYDDDSPPF